LLEEVKVNSNVKNKFGYLPSDISMNLETRETFEAIIGGDLSASQYEENLEQMA